MHKRSRRKVYRKGNKKKAKKKRNKKKKKIKKKKKKKRQLQKCCELTFFVRPSNVSKDKKKTTNLRKIQVGSRAAESLKKSIVVRVAQAGQSRNRLQSSQS
jgi:hypothetical protein